MSLKDIIDQSKGRIELIDATPRFKIHSISMEEGLAIDRRNAAIYAKGQCPECDRVFDLVDETDAEEWAFGHDCEV